MPNKSKKVFPPEQQVSIEELIMPSDEEITKMAQEIGLAQQKDYTGVKLEAIEKAMFDMAQRFESFRTETPRGAWPRIEILIDSNCLVTYTGPMEQFDKPYFMELLQETIAGRLDMTKTMGEAMKGVAKGPPRMEVA